MEPFYFCWSAILKEANEHAVFFAKKPKREFGASSNFNLTINRLEYLYKHGTLMINLAEQGILNSSKSTPEILKLYNDLISKQNCKICSLSNGPGVEVVGLVYGLRKHVNAFKNVSVCVTTKSNEWKALSEILINSKQHSISSVASCIPSNFQFLSCEMTVLSPEVRQNIQYCDVLLMFRSYEFFPDLTVFKKILNEVFSLMKKDAIIFFFDGKARMKSFISLASCGRILYGPLKVTVKDISYDSSLTQLVGLHPSSEGVVRFALWKKGVSPKESKSESMQNLKVQGENAIAQIDNNVTKISSSSSPTSFHNANITHELIQNFNSCKSSSDEYVPQTNLNTKTMKERKWQHIVSNDDSESKKSFAVSETGTSSNSSLSEKLLETDSTKPAVLNQTKKDWKLDCWNSSKMPKSPCITNIIQQEDNLDKSKLNVMVENCEKMIFALEKSLEKLSTKVQCVKNSQVNCCPHNRKLCHNFCCMSHMHMPCCVLHTRCCHCLKTMR